MDITACLCRTALRLAATKRTLAGAMNTGVRLPMVNWEYREFDMPTEDKERVFLGWLREGWELVGVHPKGKGQRKPLPVAIVRRELAAPLSRR